MHSWTSFSEVSVPALKAALRSAIVAASRSISFAEAAQRFHNNSATTNVIRPHAFISSSATLNAPTSYLVSTTAHNYVREPRAKPRDRQTQLSNDTILPVSIDSERLEQDLPKYLDRKSTRLNSSHVAISY